MRTSNRNKSQAILFIATRRIVLRTVPGGCFARAEKKMRPRVPIAYRTVRESRRISFFIRRTTPYGHGPLGGRHSSLTNAIRLREKKKRKKFLSEKKTPEERAKYITYITTALNIPAALSCNIVCCTVLNKMQLDRRRAIILPRYYNWTVPKARATLRCNTCTYCAKIYIRNTYVKYNSRKCFKCRKIFFSRPARDTFVFTGTRPHVRTHNYFQT